MADQTLTVCMHNGVPAVYDPECEKYFDVCMNGGTPHIYHSDCEEYYEICLDGSVQKVTCPDDCCGTGCYDDQCSGCSKSQVHVTISGVSSPCYAYVNGLYYLTYSSFCVWLYAGSNVTINTECTTIGKLYLYIDTTLTTSALDLYADLGFVECPPSSGTYTLYNSATSACGSSGVANGSVTFS